MPKAIIIGYTGQDGRILWDQLRAIGYDFAGISRSGVNIGGKLRDHTGPGSAEASTRELLSSFAADEVYYLAACHHGSEGQEGGGGELAARSWLTHVHQFEQLLLAVRRFSRGARVFYASSSRIFGAGNGAMLDEKSQIKPQCIYGLTKAAGMQVARHFRATDSLHVSCGILFNHESSFRGPNYLSQRVVQGLLAIREGAETPLVLGSLDAQADWGFAPDYTRAMQLMLAGSEPQDLVVATGTLHSVKDFVACAARELGVDWEKYVREAPSILARPAQGLCGDPSALKASTGWAPTVGFDAMVAGLAREAASNRPAGIDQ